MTTPTAAKPTGLYVSDDEMFRRLNVCRDKGRAAVEQLEPQGFPRKDPLFSGKRYWPAVRSFLDKRNGIGETQATPNASPEDEENW